MRFEPKLIIILHKFYMYKFYIISRHTVGRERVEYI